jgi:chromate transport protein ChrA/mannitol/fructose-specific phosphotransferase system IIA component (Ntr-type)
LRLFLTFFRIGLTTFGGGFSMATVLRHEIVLKRRWISEREFLNTLSTATSVPGAVAVNLAFLEGSRLRGLRGGIVAAAGQICPSILVILLIAQFAVPYFDHPMVSAFLKGAAIAVTGQIAFAAVTFARRLRPHWQNALACGLGLAVVGLGFHPVWAIIIAACAGYLMMRERMARREWTDEDELKLLGLINGVVSRELAGDSSREDVADTIRKRNDVVRDRFDTIIQKCHVLDLDRLTSLEEFFDLAAGELAQQLNMNPETLSSALKRREIESSTVLNQWLAVPHVIVDSEEVFEILMVRSRKGVYFSDHARRVNAIFILAGSIDERNFYLCALAAIAQITGSVGFLEQWFQAKDPQELKDAVLSAKRMEMR